MACAGGTGLLFDVRHILIPEIAKRAHHRIRRGLAEPAQARVLDQISSVPPAKGYLPVFLLRS